jgi:hypothetical protein
MKKLLHDFADKSTIAGLHYVFDRNQVSIFCFGDKCSDRVKLSK